MNTRRLQLAGAGALAVLGLAETLRNVADWQAGAPSLAARDHEGIPNVELQAHTGRRLRFRDDVVRDKLVAINMMYTGCNRTCPPTMHNLLQVQQLLGPRVGKDILMVSITLRPEQDSPAELAHYAKLHHVEPGWLFLTGASADIERLRYALGFYDPDPRVDRQEGRHVGMVRIGNSRLRRWGMAPALANPRQIAAAILRLDDRPPPGIALAAHRA